MLCTVINICTAELKLYKRIFAVTKVENTVNFQTIPIMIIGNTTTERSGVCFEITKKTGCIDLS